MRQRNVPSYSLEHIQTVFNSPKNLVMTNSAYQGMVALNFNQIDVVNAIQALTRKIFINQCPPFNLKFAAWQDVYRLNFKEIDLYIKFQINEHGELLLSFKESDND